MSKFISDLSDAAELMHNYGPQMVRCAGQRLIVQGYVCYRCKSESPWEKCNSPKPHNNDKSQSGVA